MNIKNVYTLLLSFIAMSSSAQLCQGSLGDPIINITFGAGGNPGAPISAAATGYQYVASDCPNDGYYTVRNNSTACYNNSWHNIPSDHTKDAGGYFMLVNAAYDPSAFYIDTVRGLCGNTTYEFASWIMNVNHPETCSGNPIQPNLTFKIEKTDGTPLQTYNTGNIPPLSSPDWKQYGFYFITPAGVPDIVLKIINNASGGCGNDLALDDITFRPCGPLLTPSIASQSSTTVNLCEGTAGTFDFSCQVSGGFTNPTFQWQENMNNGTWTDITGQTSSSLTRIFPANSPTGTYAFRLAVADAGNMGSSQCRINSSPLTVKISSNPVTTALNSGPVCKGSTLLLTATGGTTYQWTGPNAYSGNGSPLSIDNIQLSQAGKYHVLVKNNEGCQHLDSTIVSINPSPNAQTSFTETKICPGDSVTLQASGGVSYEWQPMAGLSSNVISSPHASPSNDVQYKVIVSNSLNCTDTAFIEVNVIEPPRANAGPDKSMLENESVALSATATGDDISYYWSSSPFINNPSSTSPIVNPPEDTKFIFNVTSRDGCGSTSDTMQVFVFKKIYVPSAFSPNADGINDTWYIPALSAYKNYELSVFNRNGEIIFHLYNDNRRWDGTFNKKRLPVGAYVYLINFKGFIPPIKGTVTIIR